MFYKVQGAVGNATWKRKASQSGSKFSNWQPTECKKEESDVIGFILRENEAGSVLNTLQNDTNILGRVGNRNGNIIVEERASEEAEQVFWHVSCHLTGCWVYVCVCALSPRWLLSLYMPLAFQDKSEVSKLLLPNEQKLKIWHAFKHM